MIEPVNGRVVWYRPNGSQEFTVYGDQPFAAQVAHVWGPRMVNLSVIDHAGQQHAVTSVPLLQDDDVPPSKYHYCEWMPYQKGQAAKA